MAFLFHSDAPVIRVRCPRRAAWLVSNPIYNNSLRGFAVVTDGVDCYAWPIVDVETDETQKG